MLFVYVYIYMYLLNNQTNVLIVFLFVLFHILLLRVDENLSVELYELKDEKDAITHFERKYVNVGVKLYQFSCHLGSRKLLNA